MNMSTQKDADGRIRVMHVDNDAQYIDLVSDYLERSEMNIEVSKETDPEKAVEKLRENNFHCIISGHDMKGLTGLELASELRESDVHTPFILLTSKKSGDVQGQPAMEYVDHHFQKNSSPKEYRELTEEIQRTVATPEETMGQGNKEPVNDRLTSYITNEGREKPGENDSAEKTLGTEIKYEKEMEKYRKMFDISPEAMLALNTDLKIENVNEAVEQYGIEPGDMKGEGIEILFEKDIISEEDFDKCLNRLEKLLDSQENSTSFETKIRSINGSVDAEITASCFGSETGGISGIALNIHELNDSELEGIRENRLNEFSSLISHDLRNPLNLAQGYLELAKETGHKEDYRVIERAHRRMEDIIDELMLITANKEGVKKDSVSLQAAFEEAFYFIGDEETKYEVEDLEVYGDRSGLISIFENLISNSIEHNSSPVKIEAGPLEDCDGFYYQDNGKGIPEDMEGNIFDYGVSSKGRGIGLSIVNRIVEMNDWKIELKEYNKTGLRFEIYTGRC